MTENVCNILMMQTNFCFFCRLYVVCTSATKLYKAQGNWMMTNV